MEQLNRLRPFRQAVYHNGFTKRRDAQQELLDSLSSLAYSYKHTATQNNKNCPKDVPIKTLKGE